MNIYRGENRLFSRLLFLQDGTTPILVSALVEASVELYQGATLLATYVLADGEQLRAGEETNELILEVTSAVTLAFTAGVPVNAKWTLKVTDTDFESEPDMFIDKQVEQLFANVL